MPPLTHSRAPSVARPAILVALVLAGLTATSWWWLGDWRTWGLMWTTLQLSVRAAAVSLPLGAILAVLLVRTDVPGRRLAIALLAALLFLPLYLQVASWDAVAGKQGWYSLLTGSLARPPLFSLRGAAWVHAMASTPWVVLIVGVGLRYVDPTLEEQARLDAGPWGVVSRIYLPRVAASLLVSALWVFVSTASDMTAADMYLLPTYARELYTGFTLGDDLAASGWRLLPGMSLIFVLVAAALAIGSWLAPAALETPLAAPRRSPLGIWRWPAFVLLVLVMLAIVGVPLGSLVYKAGMVVEQSGEERIRIWSPASFASVVAGSPMRFAREYGWTLAIGVATACVTLACAAPLAWWARRPGWPALPALLVVAVGLAVPSPLTALLIIGALDQPQIPFLVWLYDDTLFAPVLALTIRALPLSVMAAWYGVRSIASDVLESALVEGASRFGRWLYVVLPLRGAAFVLAWLLALILATGDVTSSILVTPPGVMTVAIRVFGMIHSGVDDQVAGVCLIGVLAYAVLACAAGWAVRRWNVMGPPSSEKER